MKQFDHWSFYNPVQTLVGQDKIKDLPAILATMGCKNPLFIVSQTAMTNGVMELFEAETDNNQYPLTTQEVTTDTIELLVHYFEVHQHDGIVAIGGGTVMDTAKITRLQLSLPSYTLLQLEGSIARQPERKIPLILIPTTVDSGSGATKTAYIRSTQPSSFLRFEQVLLYPDITIIDPKAFKVTSGVQTALGVAAVLARAVESLTSILSCPAVETYALQAIRLLKTHVFRIVHTPHDLVARTQLAIASQLAGIAISQTGASLAHAISITIAQTTPITYAQSMFIVLPYTLHYNLRANESVLSNIGACLREEETDHHTESEPDALATIQEISDFLNSLTDSLPQAIPLRLYESQALLPVQLAQIAETACGSLDILTSKQAPTFQDMLRILEAAYWGYPLDREHQDYTIYQRG